MRASSVFLPVLLVSVAACSSGSGFSAPKAAAFRQGSCRDLAPSVIALGRDLHGLGRHTPSADQRTSLKNAQAGVRALQSQVPADLAPTVQQLVTSVGILRLRADTDSYASTLATTATSAYRAVVTACTSPAS